MGQILIPEPVQDMLTAYLNWLGRKHDNPDDALEDHKIFRRAWDKFVDWMESRGAEVDDLRR